MWGGGASGALCNDCALAREDVEVIASVKASLKSRDERVREGGRGGGCGEGHDMDIRSSIECHVVMGWCHVIECGGMEAGAM
eukprot:222892-Chlamydomonas_euryale.AAC.1